MVESTLEELFEEICDAGFFINNLFQSQARYEPSGVKLWRCNLRKEGKDRYIWYAHASGCTAQEAVIAALKLAKDSPDNIIPNHMPRFMTKAFVGEEQLTLKSETPEPLKRPRSLEDMF